MGTDRCFVTGASGFIGRALVDRLIASGASVRGLSRAGDRGTHRPDVDMVAGDLARGPFEAAGLDDVDVVFHLAAKTHDLVEGAGAADEYRRVNVEGTRRLLDAMQGRAVRRLVFASSVKAVGEGGDACVDETTPAAPVTPYGVSKLQAEAEIREAAAREGFEAVCLRFPIVYGPSQRGNLQRMVAAVASHRFPPPPDTGNRRSMLYVGNAVEALILAAESPAAAGETYFVTDRRPYSTREIYDLVRMALGRPPARWSVPAGALRLLASAGDLARRLAGRRVGFDTEALGKLLGSAWYDSAKITRDLGYVPAAGLPDVMPALVAAAREGEA